MHPDIQTKNITLSGSETQGYDARTIHSVLGSKRQYGNWIKERIETYGFIEGEDFLTNLLKNTSDPKGRGRPSKDYYVSLDMGKELAMLENNDIGRQVRRWFIRQEQEARAILKQKARQTGPVPVTTTTQELIEYIERGGLVEGALLPMEAAQGLNIRPQKIYPAMALLGWVRNVRPKGKKPKWIAVQKYLDKGWLTVRTHTFIHPHSGYPSIDTQVFITPQGYAELGKLLLTLRETAE